MVAGILAFNVTLLPQAFDLQLGQSGPLKKNAVSAGALGQLSQ